MMPKFVLAWITSSDEHGTSLQDGGHVVFVRHPERGWEIPGGHLNDGESPETALCREILEETGLQVTIKTWNKTYYPEGWVASVVTDAKPSSQRWEVDDSKVEEIGWWSEVPPVVKWTKQEFIDLDEWFNTSN